MSAATLFPFGKYSGQSVYDVERKDQRYCKWVLDQPWITEFEDLHNALKMIRDAPMRMPFGKYKDQPIKSIVLIDYRYYQWLYDKFRNDNTPLGIEIRKYY